MEKETHSRFLVYGLIDPLTGELRYVGKSSWGMKRPKQHLQSTGRKGNTHLKNWLRRLYKDGQQLPAILILRECVSDIEALAQEVVLIALFRQAGFNLANITEGGEGSCGWYHSAETISKIRESNKGKKMSYEARCKISACKIGKKFSQESRDNMSKAQLKREHNPEDTAKARAANLGLKRSEETKAKLRAAWVGRVVSKETCEKISAGGLGKKRSEEARANMKQSWILRKQKTGNSLLENIA
jgi:hypothetical protein